MKNLLLISVMSILLTGCVEDIPDHVCEYNQSVYDSRCRAYSVSMRKAQQAEDRADSLAMVGASQSRIDRFLSQMKKQLNKAQEHKLVMEQLVKDNPCKTGRIEGCP